MSSASRMSWPGVAGCRDNVRIQFDYYHAQNVDGQLSAMTKAMFARIGHIQIASVPDRHEPDEGA